jgi:HemY protein
LLRVLGSLVIVALVAAGAVYIADRPGSVAIEWNGFSAHPTVPRLMLAVLALFLVLAALLWALRFLIGAPGAMVRRRRERRRHAGYGALTHGMVAVAAGDAEEARRLARKADALLAEPPLTLLLQAQSAQLDGDETAAHGYFQAMLERPETEFLGVRGLLMQALKGGDEASALPLAERAHKLKPRATWALRQLTELQARAGHLQAARTTLGQAIKHKALPPPEGKRFEAALLLEQSRAAASAGDPSAALTLAHRAQQADPGFAPAAAWYASLLRDTGRLRRAARAIEGAWRHAPEPSLAAVYRSLATDQNAMAALKRIERLAASNPDHLESLLLLAEAALNARLWGEARRHLLKTGIEAVPEGGSARAHRLMADIEESERGDGAAARRWLARAAATAVLEPTYVCASCSSESARWVAICPVCRSFASIAWQRPTRAPRPQLLAFAPAPEATPGAGSASGAAGGQPRLTAAKGES